MVLYRILVKLGLMLSVVRLLPHLLLLALSGSKPLIVHDLGRWASLKMGGNAPRGVLYRFVYLMTFLPEYRNVFYIRLGGSKVIVIFLRLLCRPMPTLFINTKDVGPGLFFQHGFSAIVSAKKIGKDCWINQQVTIGYSDAGEGPTLGDNVAVYAGAVVIGNITIGDNARIGANAVVVKNVPPDCTVVGVPAYIVRRNGVRTKEPLG
jgi:serine O-acetyltransferase